MQSALKLFGKAVTRERRTLGISQSSTVLEQALLGELQCACALQDQQLIERVLLKIGDLNKIGPASNITLNLLTAGELVQRNELGLALGLLLNIENLFELAPETAE